MNAELETFFSPDYSAARGRFRAAARSAGARLDALELEARGPTGEPLAIDIGWLGAADATRLVLHTSGMHGVEAYAGAAIQLAALAGFGVPPAGCALALVHVMNPYGMAWHRRVNENNVDLNRNFLKPGEPWSGVHPLYARIDRVLNPASPPGFDLFPLVAGALILRHGFEPLQQALAEGQYRYPRGLFYGGAEMQPGPRRYLDWLRECCGRARYVFALDVHTGLGRWWEQTVILEPGVGVTAPATLTQALQSPLTDPTQGGSTVYVSRGSMGARLPQALPDAAVDFVAQEFGTYPPFRVLRALRQENRWHQYGRATPDHRSKLALLEAFCPDSTAWRRRVVERGTRLLRAVCDWTFKEAARGSSRQ
ncbi:MAG TPA: DUF2817 domain-containing protein [Burkholderiales bacterium]|nr:DUF2817 domain-containing protein [Burkholderiales bacterium]